MNLATVSAFVNARSPFPRLIPVYSAFETRCASQYLLVRTCFRLNLPRAKHAAITNCALNRRNPLQVVDVSRTATDRRIVGGQSGLDVGRNRLCRCLHM